MAVRGREETPKPSSAYVAPAIGALMQLQGLKGHVVL